jgi:8-oxo-dGTP pyrophosphatase MutT (NUDIX family)
MFGDDLARQSLTRLIRNHSPADTQERVHRETIKSWLARAPNPLDRLCYEPGHAVASGFVVSRDSRIALVHHSNLNRWLQPGGHAEAHETDLALIASREIGEELGITVQPRQLTPFDVDVQWIPARRSAPQHQHYDIRFLCLIDPVALTAASDASDARWVTPTQAGRLGLDRGLQRMIEKVRLTGELVA